jgi:hypothetical protein
MRIITLLFNDYIEEDLAGYTVYNSSTKLALKRLGQQNTLTMQLIILKMSLEYKLIVLMVKKLNYYMLLLMLLIF